jgi:hypothetical protein
MNYLGVVLEREKDLIWIPITYLHIGPEETEQQGGGTSNTCLMTGRKQIISIYFSFIQN